MKTRYLLLILVLCFVLGGCSGAAGNQSSGPTDQNVALPSLPSIEPAAAGQIDVDLSAMNSTMVYAEVYNMTNMPENYIGKTIKLNGIYDNQYYEEIGKDYHFVMIADAAACCQSGIEIVWKGDHKYPDDYPTAGDNVEVVGVYGSYEEEGTTFYCLTVDAITPV